MLLKHAATYPAATTMRLDQPAPYENLGMQMSVTGIEGMTLIQDIMHVIVSVWLLTTDCQRLLACARTQVLTQTAAAVVLTLLDHGDLEYTRESSLCHRSDVYHTQSP